MSDILSSLAQDVFDFTVHCTATFLAAVLSHPAVEEAAANVVRLGANAFITQPDLDEKLKITSETLAKSQEESARTAGEDFPKVVGAFFTGVFAKKDKEEKPKEAIESIEPAKDTAMIESSIEVDNDEKPEEPALEEEKWDSLSSETPAEPKKDV